MPHFIFYLFFWLAALLAINHLMLRNSLIVIAALHVAASRLETCAGLLSKPEYMLAAALGQPWGGGGGGGGFLHCYAVSYTLNTSLQRKR
jgi:hypothetical protein